MPDPLDQVVWKETSWLTLALAPPFISFSPPVNPSRRSLSVTTQTRTFGSCRSGWRRSQGPLTGLQWSPMCVISKGTGRVMGICFSAFGRDLMFLSVQNTITIQLKSTKETQRQRPKGTPDGEWGFRRTDWVPSALPEYYLIVNPPTKATKNSTTLTRIFNRQKWYEATMPKGIHYSPSVKLSLKGTGRWSVGKDHLASEMHGPAFISLPFT